MMNEIVNQQTLLFLKSIQIGVAFAVLYDTIRLLRKSMHHPNWMIQVEDTLYWVACTVLGFIALYMHNYANIRIYIFLGMILGAILYLLTLSAFFMRIAMSIIAFIKQVVEVIIRLIEIPIKCLIQCLKIPLNALARLFNLGVDFSSNQHKQLKRKKYFYEADYKTKKRINKNNRPRKAIDQKKQ